MWVGSCMSCNLVELWVHTLKHCHSVTNLIRALFRMMVQLPPCSHNDVILKLRYESVRGMHSALIGKTNHNCIVYYSSSVFGPACSCGPTKADFSPLGLLLWLLYQYCHRCGCTCVCACGGLHSGHCAGCVKDRQAPL